MNRWTTLALAALCAGANAQTTIFYDNFETNALGSEPSTAIWNSGNSNPASTNMLSAYDSTSGYPGPRQGAMSMYAPVAAASGRKRYWGNFTAPVNSATDVVVLSFDLYDDYALSSAGNARQFIQLTDYATDYDRSSALLQLVAIGNWNAANALNVGPLNGGYVGTVSGLGTYYHGRLLYAGTGYWLPGATGSVVSWFVMGYEANKRRSTGWHEHKIAYSPAWAKWYSDGVQGFFYNHGKPAAFDQITIPPNESSPIPAYYDSILVRTFPINSFNAKVNLLDFSGDRTQQPLTVEFTDGGGTQTFSGLFIDAYGTVTVPSLTPGTYDVRVKGTHWLAKMAVGVVVDEAGSHNLTFDLINGDVDGDNEVGPGDFSNLAAAFGSMPGDGNWDPMADLDGDEEVGPNDFSVLSTNFGLAGD